MASTWAWQPNRRPSAHFKPSDGDPWRKKADDDLLFAVGIALWIGEQVIDQERRVLKEQAIEAERLNRARSKRARRRWQGML